MDSFCICEIHFQRILSANFSCYSSSRPFCASPSIESALIGIITDRRPSRFLSLAGGPGRGGGSGEFAPVGSHSSELAARERESASNGRDTCRENDAAARLRRCGSWRFRCFPRPRRAAAARYVERGSGAEAADMRRTAGLGASGAGQRSRR